MAVKGIVIRGHGKSFIVKCGGEEIPCEIRGKVKFLTRSATPVAVGDDVLISRLDDGSGAIEEVLERKSMFFRPSKESDDKKQVIAANIDQLAAVVSVAQPILKPGLIDRFIIAAELGGLIPLIIINKIDLGQIPLLDEINSAYKAINIPIVHTSAESGEGMDNLINHLKDHRTIFAGHSGVGKSSLLNRLMPNADLPVGEISEYSAKGRHTTSWVEMFEIPGSGFVIDSPGLKILKLWEVEREQLEAYYPEMAPFLEHCKFHPCSHTHEPGCAVKRAVDKGEMSRLRYDNYVAIYESIDTPQY